MANENTKEFYPISVLIDELRNEDIHARLNSIKHLSTIALALGPEKTRSQLIPFLTDSIYDEEDVLIALTDEFINLTDYIGGLKYVHVLLHPLETFAAVEEGVVREKGVQVLRKLAFYHSKESIREYFYPLVKRYGDSQWFGTKCSAVALFPVIYPRVTESMKDNIIEMLQKIIDDEIPIVRKAAATKIGELVIVMLGKTTPQELITDLPLNLDINQDQNKENLDTFTNPEGYNYSDEMERFRSSIIPIIRKLWSDKQEPVRLSLLQSVIEIACVIKPEELDELSYLREIITEAVSDSSWRVRCIAADRYPSIIKAFSFGNQVELVDLFTKLLRDEELEVRIVSLNKSKSIAYHLVNKDEIVESENSQDKDFYKNELDNRILFNSDPSNGNSIQSELSNPFSSSPLLPVNRDQSTNGQYVSPNEADAKNSNNILQKKLTLINNFVNSDSIAFGDVDYLIFRIDPFENAVALKEYRKKILETKDLRQINFDANGRVLLLNDKLQQTKDLPSNGNVNDPDNENDHNISIIDDKKIPDGDELITKNLIPNLLQLSTDNSVLIRIGLANSIMSILPLLSKDSIENLLLPTIMNQLSDNISDVRLNLISRFEYLIDVIGPREFFNKLIPAIEVLAKDKKWRIRLGVMNYILLLAEKFGTKIFSESLVSVSISFLLDTSYAIRLAAVTNLTKLAIIFGSDWAFTCLLPSIIKVVAKAENYLFRMMCLEAIITFVEVLEVPGDTLDRLLDDTLAFSHDVIPNIRFKAAQALSRIGLKVPEACLNERVLLRLEELLKDSDSDVVFFANEAYISLKPPTTSNELNSSDDSQPQPMDIVSST